MLVVNSASGVGLLLIITRETLKSNNMDSSEIVYATVEEIIGKTGKQSSRADPVQAPEEVLHKLKLTSSARSTVPS